MASLGERFYRAFLAADDVGLADVVAADAKLVLRGGLLAGAHDGPGGIAAPRRRCAELTGDPRRPLREDSFSLTESEWHAVVLAVENGRSARLFHYVHDPDAFGAFWV